MNPGMDIQTNLPGAKQGEAARWPKPAEREEHVCVAMFLCFQDAHKLLAVLEVLNHEIEK